VREPVCPAIVTLPTLLLLVGRRRFQELFRKAGNLLRNTGNLFRALWRAL